MTRLIRDFIEQCTTPAPVISPALDSLTDREREVLALIAGGLSNTDIAGQLTISVATVKTHVSRLLAKLAAHDRAQLVAIAYETGLVEITRRH